MLKLARVGSIVSIMNLTLKDKWSMSYADFDIMETRVQVSVLPFNASITLKKSLSLP